MSGPEQQPNKIVEEETIGIERLRDMLLALAESHPHEIEQLDQCQSMIKTYFTETKSLPIHKLV